MIDYYLINFISLVIGGTTLGASAIIVHYNGNIRTGFVLLGVSAIALVGYVHSLITIIGAT